MDNVTVIEHRRRLDGGWGVAPQIVNLIALKENGQVRLSWKVPSAITVDGQTIVATKGVVIRRSTDGFPRNELSGELVLDTPDFVGTFVDDELDNDTTYYYRAFSYSDHNVYNREEGINMKSITPNNNSKIYITFTSDEAIGCTLVATKDNLVASGEVYDYVDSKMALIELPEEGEWNVAGRKINITTHGQSIYINEEIYGYDWDLSEPNPDYSITYPSTVDNYGFKPIGSREGAESNDYSLNSDMQKIHDFVSPRPVMLDFDGTVLYEFDHNDQTKEIDGRPSNISDTERRVNAMVEFPKRYMKRWTDGNNIAHFRISRMKLSADYKCYPWMYGDSEENAVENDFIYCGMIEPIAVSMNGTDVLRTVASKTVKPVNNLDTVTEETSINALGNAGWGGLDLAFCNYIADLMILMGKSTDVQDHFGNGHVSGSGTAGASWLWSPGRLVEGHGPYYGSPIANTDVRFMWLENFYGDRANRTYGAFYVDNKVYVKDFPPYSNVHTNLTNYINLNRGITNSNGYISEITYDQHGILPKTLNGSATTYLPDGGVAMANGMLNFGDSCLNRNTYVGLAYKFEMTSTTKNWTIGPWLMFRPNN